MCWWAVLILGDSLRMGTRCGAVCGWDGLPCAWRVVLALTLGSVSYAAEHVRLR